MAENRLKILVVDDKADNLAVARAVAADAFPGCEVFTAQDGETGIALARAHDPDAILLDVRMPGLDGYETCRRLKAEPGLADIPVVFLTAIKINNEARLKAMEAGAETFVSKPFEEAEFAAQVRLMAKVKAGSLARRREKERLASLVEERTRELIEEADGRKRTGEALAEAESRFSMLFSKMSEGFALHEIICDANGTPADYRFLEVNAAFEKLTGLKKANLIGRTVLEVMPATEKRWIETYGHVALTGETLKLEDFSGALGKYYSVTAFSPKRGQFAVVFTDITERRRGEEKLRRALDSLNKTQVSARIGTWELDHASGRLEWSDEVYRIFGAEPGAFPATYEAFLSYVHPDDRAAVDQAYSGSLASGQPGYEIEHRVISGAETLTVREKCEHYRDAEGRVLRSIGFVQDVTGLKRAEEKLRRLTDMTPGVVYQYRLWPDGRSCFPYASSGMWDIYEVTPEDVREDATPVFGRLHPDALKPTSEVIFRSARENSIFHWEFRVVLPQQGLRWRRCDARPERLPDGSTLWYGTITDITDRKKAEERLDRINRALLGLGGDYDANIEKLTALCGELFGADCALYNRLEGRLLTSLGQWQAPPGYRPSDKPEGHICYDVIKGAGEEGLLLVRDLPATPYSGTDPNVSKYNLRTYLGHVVRDGAVPVGSLCAVFARDFEPGGDDRRLLGILASALGMEEKRRAARRELERSEAKFKDLVENLNDIVFALDGAGTITYISPRSLPVTGYSPEELIGAHFTKLTHPDEAQRLGARLREIMGGKLEADKFRWVHKDGSVRWARTSARPSRADGEVTGITGVFSDITESRKMEEELESERRQLDAVFEFSPVGLLLFDEKMEIARANTAAAVLCASDMDSLKGQRCGAALGCVNSKLSPAGCGESGNCPPCRLNDGIRTVLAGGNPLRGEELLLETVRDGVPMGIWTLAGAERVTLGGRPFAIVSLDNITQRKAAEAEAQRNQAKYEAIFGHSPIAIEHYDAEGALLGINAACAEMFGLTDPAEIAGFRLFDDPNIPDDLKARLHGREAVQVEASFDFEKIKALKLYNTTRSGTALLDYRIVPMTEGDRLTGYVAQIQDITERKRAEAELMASEERHRTILRAALSGFWLADTAGRLLEVNDAYCRMSGYSEAELLEKNIGDLDPVDPDVPGHARRIMDAGWDRFESQHRRKDGTLFDVEVSVQFRKADGGRFVVFVHDITERKKTERALRESEERFSDAFEHAAIGMALLSVEGRWLKTNAALGEILGYGAEELRGLSFREVTHPEDAAANYESMKKLLTGKAESFQTEKRYLHKSGRLVWAWLSVSLVRDGDGEPLYFVSQVSDITSRKKAEDATLRHSELLSAINVSGDARALAKAVTGMMVKWTGCEAVGIRLRQEEDFPYFETRGFPSEFVKAESSLCETKEDGSLVRDTAGSPVLECMCGNVLRGRFDPALPFFTKKGSFWTNSTTELLASTSEADRQARTRNRCNGEGYESVALVPLRSGLEVIGLLQVNSKQKGRLDSDLLAFLEYAADQLAMAFSHLFSQAALRGSEARLTKAQSAAKVGSWELNMGTGAVTASEEVRRIYGYSRTERLTLEMIRKIPLEKYRPALAEALKALLEGRGLYDMEFEIEQVNTGRRLWIHSKAELSLDSRGAPRVTGILQDVTESKTAQERIQASLAEKEVLLKEIHHRVKNNLQVVSSLLNLQAKTVKDPAAVTVLKDSRSRVRAMALVHEILYRSNDFSRINMKEYAARLVDGIRGAYSAGGGVSFEADIQDCPLSVDTAVALGLILSELVSNAIKHAFSAGKAGTVKITIAPEGAGYFLQVEDDGPGLPPDYDLRKAGSLGMQLVTTLAGQISGSIEAGAGEKGARFKITFPG